MNFHLAFRYGMVLFFLAAALCVGNLLLADIKSQREPPGGTPATRTTVPSAAEPQSDSQGISRTTALVSSLTVFLLAVFVGVEVITKVPPTLHTPLMSGSNAISGITIIGAILVAGNKMGGFGSFLGLIAVILAMINVVGGFLVTHRMLMMFKKR